MNIAISGHADLEIESLAVIFGSFWSVIPGPVDSGDRSICNTAYGGLWCNNDVEAIDYTAYRTTQAKRTQH